MLLVPLTGMLEAPDVNVNVWRIAGVMGRTQPDHDIGIDLRKARAKTATGSLTSTLKSGI